MRPIAAPMCMGWRSIFFSQPKVELHMITRALLLDLEVSGVLTSCTRTSISFPQESLRQQSFNAQGMVILLRHQTEEHIWFIFSVDR